MLTTIRPKNLQMYMYKLKKKIDSKQQGSGWTFKNVKEDNYFQKIRV